MFKHEPFFFFNCWGVDKGGGTLLYIHAFIGIMHPCTHHAHAMHTPCTHYAHIMHTHEYSQDSDSLSALVGIL